MTCLGREIATRTISGGLKKGYQWKVMRSDPGES
jgi:hypothetical protein